MGTSIRSKPLSSIKLHHSTSSYSKSSSEDSHPTTSQSSDSTSTYIHALRSRHLTLACIYIHRTSFKEPSLTLLHYLLSFIMDIVIMLSRAAHTLVTFRRSKLFIIHYINTTLQTSAFHHGPRRRQFCRYHQ